MQRRNRLKAAAMAALLATGGAYAVASWDWCPRPDAAAPKLVSRLQATGPLEAGAGAVEIRVPFPIIAAGYGPPRPELKTVALPLKARATVLRQGNVTFGLVSLDLLLVPDDVAEEIRSKSGLGDVWVAATHTHSSFGAYDSRLIAQLAGTGRFRPQARAVVVDAALQALKAASATVRVTVELARGSAALGAARSGAQSDTRITRVRFGTVAQWLLLAAHPTLVTRPAAALDPDYPGLLAERTPGTLVLQTAGGNARADAASPGELADRATAAFEALPAEPLPEPQLSVTRVQLTPPAADATRLVPRLFAMPGKNFLCASAPRTAEVGVLKLGPVELLAIPAEVTHAAGEALGPGTVLSLTNGYLGYVEPAEVVDRAEGESKRQYYQRGLLDAFRAALAAGR